MITSPVTPRDYFANELSRALHVEVQYALHQLIQQRRITTQLVSGLYLYTAIWNPIEHHLFLRDL
jgi:hypothetical protein